MFDDNAAGAHDIVVADMDRDGKPDVVMMGDERTKLNALCWYSIPRDVRQPWTRHPIGPPVHSAITPGGVADLDGDGDLDVVRADTWFRNADGKGARWEKFPVPQSFTYGSLHALAVADMYGDGKPDIIANEQEELL